MATAIRFKTPLFDLELLALNYERMTHMMWEVHMMGLSPMHLHTVSVPRAARISHNPNQVNVA